MSNIRPNAEQMEILRAARTGASMVIEALAGTGKTSTLELMGRDRPAKRMLYFAYNKATQLEAAARMPRNVTSKTSHSLAFRPVGLTYQERLDAPRVTARAAAGILSITRPLVVEDEVLGPVALQPSKLAQLALGTVRNFANSADPEVSEGHVPWVPGLGLPESRAQLVQAVLPYGQAAWTDLVNRDGRLKFEHDHYLKLYQLSHPRLPYDVILLDEAQDSNPAVMDLVTGQKHAQVILVGDSNQAIYGWRGAVDAMDQFAADVRLPLTGSYRFGPELAEEANRWLELIGTTARLKGWKKLSTGIDDGTPPTAIITRTNGQAVAELIRNQEDGRRVALVSAGPQDPRGTNAITAMARAATTLMAGAGTDHPELLAFTTWEEVVNYTREDPAGSDLAPFVRMVNEYGPDSILSAAAMVVPEAQADVTITTAHKAKGRQWQSVQIGPDFKVKEGVPSKPELMLNYVAVTRAQTSLQRGSLAAIDRLSPRATEQEAQPSE